MTHTIRLSALFAFLAGVAISAQGPKPDAKPLDDAEFVKMAASGGMHEVEAGKVALAQAKAEPVKKFAQKMIDDHTKAGEELKAAAKSAGLAVPEKMTEKDQKSVDALKEAKGDGFDRRYLADQLKSHQESADLFERASKGLKNAELKAFATKTLPVVKGHLEMLKKMQGAGE
jgi:putative membrane protein